MSKTVRVNLRSVINKTGVKEEDRNGRKVMIAPSATLPDNVVMNGIRYPAEEIEKSYRSLNRKPAPLGHPMIGGNFVSALDPEGLNIGYIGAWNDNVRRDKGRVFLDKVIDVEVANRSEGGKRVLEALRAGKPVHTSTGLVCTIEETADGDNEAEFTAKDIVFDHDAILLDEEGAATPEQGVGMLVNGHQIQVINSSLTERMDLQLDWAVEEVARVYDQRARLPIIETIKAALEKLFSSDRGTSATQEKDDMADEKQLEALSAKVNALEEKVTSALANSAEEAQKLLAKFAEDMTAMLKPVMDNAEAEKAKAKAAEDKEKEELTEKVVKSNLLSKEAASELTLNALRELAKKAVPGKAAALNGAPVVNSAEDDFAGYDLNSNFGEKK